MKEKYDYAVTGGGIVGLATALKLSDKYPDAKIALFEKETEPARHQTGHNSGVIHSGLYYKPGSLKARLCVDGRRQLIEFARKHGVPHEICGKLVVATDPAEVERLRTLFERGQKNGLAGLEWIEGDAGIRAREPNIRGLAAVVVPEEGIIDYKAMCREMVKELERRGVTLRFRTEVRSARTENEFVELSIGDGTRARAGFAIFCGGLQSDRLARASGAATDVRIVPFRGEYYKFTPAARARVRHLVYPVPDPQFPFLGVHFTRMTDGEVECGPNAVLALAREGYRKFDFNLSDVLGIFSFRGAWRIFLKHWRPGLGELQRSLSKPAFVRALRKLMPDLDGDELVYAGSGIRAQAVRPDGSLVDDFEFADAPRQRHVLNAPSPAATASLAIADHIVASIGRSS